MSEVHSSPSSNLTPLRVSGLKLENSSAISNPSERILASIVSAFERQRMDAPQHLPVSFCDRAWHSADSLIVEAKRE